MKQKLFLVSIVSLIIFSCKKTDLVEPKPTSLEGKWRMIVVKDNASGFTTTKPSSIQGDVDITFSSTTMQMEVLPGLLQQMKYGKMAIQ